MSRPHHSLNTTATGRVCPGRHPRFCRRRHERGTALIMSLVILLILTILGVTAMSTSSLQEKMAGNLQDMVRAIEAAESGASQALATTPLVPYSAAITLAPMYYGTIGQQGTANVTVSFMDESPPGASNAPGIFSKTGGFKYAHFDLASNGTAAAGAQGIVHQGVRVLVPGS